MIGLLIAGVWLAIVLAHAVWWEWRACRGLRGREILHYLLGDALSPWKLIYGYYAEYGVHPRFMLLPGDMYFDPQSRSTAEAIAVVPRGYTVDILWQLLPGQLVVKSYPGMRLPVMSSYRFELPMGNVLRNDRPDVLLTSSGRFVVRLDRWDGGLVLEVDTPPAFDEIAWFEKTWAPHFEEMGL